MSLRRRRYAPVLALGLATAAAAGGQSAPRPAALPLPALARGVLHSGLATTADPAITYELYLPGSFAPDRPTPLLLVFDPRARGRLAAEIFVAAAERRGWIVASSNDTRSDVATMEPNVRAVNAMLPDLVRRLPVDPQRIYAAGFSGGGMLAWLVGVRTGQLAGVIAVGGRPPDGFETQPASFAFWGAAGTRDFNYQPTRALGRLAAASGRLHRIEIFDGGHEWFPAAEAGRALAWLEAVAMREGRRPADGGLAAELLQDELAAAEARAAAGDPWSAQHAFATAAATFAGLTDVAAAERRARELERDSAYRQAADDEDWAADFEAAAERRLGQTLALLRRAEPVPPAARLRSTLDLRALLAQAAKGGRRGAAAERALAGAHVQLAFYQMRELFAAGDHARALPGLLLAAEIRPDDATTRYNLACAQARTGRRKDALESLARALDLGLPNPAQLATDPDLEALRQEPPFPALVERAQRLENRANP